MEKIFNARIELVSKKSQENREKDSEKYSLKLTTSRESGRGLRILKE